MKKEAIIKAILSDNIKITDHADEEAANDHLTFEEIFYTVLYGQIIETYSTDKPYPSCLIYGQTFTGDPVHSVWAYDEQTRISILVTVYRPDPKRWIKWIERRKR